MKEKIPYDNSLEDIKVRIRNTFNNPNIGRSYQTELKSGPQCYKFATIFEVLDPSTNTTHHFYLRLDTVNRTKNKGWFSKTEKSIIITDDKSNELKKLKTFLHTNLDGEYKSDDTLHIVKHKDFKKLEMLLEELPNLATSDQLQLIKAITENIRIEDINILQLIELFENEDNKVLGAIGTVTRLLTCKKEIEKLKAYIANNDKSEIFLQNFLKNNAWMFGSEYSKILDKRKYTRDTQQDFVLQRTSDGYLEIIEIKLPIQEDLMLLDKSHNSYYPSSKLSVAIGQVIKYIEDVDRDRDSIIAKDEVDPLKIRAKIIIGRSNDKYENALRNLNYHLNRIEIITYDHLMKICERVISVYEEENQNNSENEPAEDLPF